jgi:transcriptional regulator with XRE-family HTH domain
MQVLRSIEAFRFEQHWGIRDFARYLGVTPRTYTQLITNPEQVTHATKRKIMLKLKVSPYQVRELVPQIAPADLAAIRAEIADADAKDSWVVYDTEGNPTGESARTLR